jgi:hypothetical protein
MFAGAGLQPVSMIYFTPTLFGMFACGMSNDR